MIEFNLDNSAFSLLSCDRKFQLRVVEGKDEPKGDEAAFGDTVHKGLEFLDKEGLPDELIPALHHQQCREIPKALTLITFYKSSVKLPPPIKLANGAPAIELKFSHDYGTFVLPNSHERLLVRLVGTIDRIHIDEATDTLVILDYKTTAVGSTYQIDKKLSEYSLAFQLPFYLYALKSFGILPASYAEYLTERRYRMEIHLLCYNATPPIFKKFVRSAFPDDFIEREVPLIINAKITKAVEIAALKTPAPHTGMTIYKACDFCGFRPACLVMGTAREAEILSRYDVNPYNPLTFR